MNKKIPNHKHERGITLIALVITIILLVILAAVTIRALTGDNGLISAGLTATEEYSIKQDQEKLEQEVARIAVKAISKSQELSLSDLANELSAQTDWIKSAVKTDKGDIIVTLLDGNMFQVYYSGVYGAKFVEYIGKDDGNPVPVLRNVRYDEKGNAIKATATIDSGSVKLVEMSYRGSLQGSKKDSETEGEMTFELKEKGNGWYVLRATSDKGKLRYAWIKLSSGEEDGNGGGSNTGKLPVPSITVTSSEAPVGDWYKSSVTVTITANLQAGQTIKYSTVLGASTNADTENGTTYVTPFTVATNGITTVYAWTTDGKTNSVPAKRLIKIDPDAGKPAEPETPTSPTVIAEAKNEVDVGNRGWIKGPVTIKIQENVASTGNKYIYYEITNPKTNEKETGGPITGNSTSIEYTKNGEYKIEAWYTKETGGTEGPRGEASFKIDADKPLPANITVSEANAGPATDINNKDYYYHDKATVTVEPRNDATSGIYGVRIEVTGANQIAIDDYETATSKEIEITQEGTSYVKAWTIDNAGNVSQEVSEITIHIDNTEPEVTNLNLEVTRGTSPLSNGWYNSEDVEVTITADTTGVTTMPYRIVYGTRPKGNEDTPEDLASIEAQTTTKTITEEGKTEVIAYAETEHGKKSQLKTLDVQIDRTPPTVESITCTKEETGIKMIANNAVDNEGGAGIDEYVFFVDNDASPEKVVRSEINETIYATSSGLFLGQVVVYDKAGNPSTLTSVELPEMQGVYTYDVLNLDYNKTEGWKNTLEYNPPSYFMTNNDGSSPGCAYFYTSINLGPGNTFTLYNAKSARYLQGCNVYYMPGCRYGSVVRGESLDSCQITSTGGLYYFLCVGPINGECNRFSNHSYQYKMYEAKMCCLGVGAYCAPENPTSPFLYCFRTTVDLGNYITLENGTRSNRR